MEGKHLIFFSLMMQSLFFELLTTYKLISYFTPLAMDIVCIESSQYLWYILGM